MDETKRKELRGRGGARQIWRGRRVEENGVMGEKGTEMGCEE